MTDSDRKILEEDGWEIECESPFEISLKDDPESRATGQAAWYILHYLQSD